MKVILLEDIKDVGKKDQLINVSDGYVKNFLLPKKLAIVADKNNVLKLDNIKKIEEENTKKILDESLDLAKKIESLNIQMHAKLGNNGKLFGAITNKEISFLLSEAINTPIEKKKIVLTTPIKTLGEKEVTVKLHKKVTATLKITITEQN